MTQEQIDRFWQRMLPVIFWLSLLSLVWFYGFWYGATQWARCGS